MPTLSFLFHPHALARLLLALACLLLPAALHAQEPAPAAVPEPAPAQVKQLIELLGDQGVRSWLQQQLAAPAPAVPATAESRTTAAEDLLEMVLGKWRAHRVLIADALPQLPAALADALGRLNHELSGFGLPVLLPLMALFIGSGLLAEWLFLRGSRKLRRRVLDSSERTIGERLRKAVLRLALALLSVVIFAVASLGMFLVLEWPLLFREVAIRVLFAAILFRLGMVLARFLLAPALPRLRIIPMPTEDAWFWLRRWSLLLGVFLFGSATVMSLRVLGALYPMPLIVAYLFGLVLLAIALETVWRLRREAVDDAAADGDLSDMPSVVPAVLVTVLLVLLYLLWLQAAMRAFWLLAVLAFVPAAIRVTQRAVDNLLRPVGSEMAEVGATPPSVLAAVVERGARMLWIVGGALTLGWAWDLDLIELTQGGTGRGRMVAALLSIVLIALLADFVWHVAKTAIDSHIQGAQVDPHGPPLDGEEARKRGRIRTLLPIIRNILFVLLLVTAVLMALSALGVQIAPLLAGAGVIGVAVGFGSQTLVRDIMSGIFYLLDDAFRVGEYIVSGSYKGTVESFSLRSIKLRHQRGPLYTVPFGALGAIQNLSRDWVIDKLMFNVTYDTDLPKIKKVVKQVSAEIMADPELAQNIIEPLKSQGVYNMGDFAIQIRLKITCKPGQQFVVRRVIYEKIKRAFDAAGIKFAFPTVTVAGGEANPAVAQQAIQMTQPAEG